MRTARTTAAPLSSTDAARLDLHEDALGHGGRAAHGPGPAAGPEAAVLGWRVCAPRPRGPAVRLSSTHNKAQARATTLSQSSVSGLLWGGGGRGLAGPSQTVWGAAALRLNRTHVEVLRWPRPPVSWTVPGRRPCQTPGPRLLPCARHVQRCLAKGAAGPPTLVMQYLFHWVSPSDLTL